MMSYQLLTSFEPPYPGPLRQLVDGARGDLATRLGLHLNAVAVEGLHAVIWSDGSIGCPRQGLAYTQALVEGALIELRVGGVSYHYHSAEGLPPFLCERTEA
jgi:hypothetical protein